MDDVDYRWPSAARAWLDLPAPVRAEMVAAGAESWREVFDGRATYNEQWRLARPPVMDETSLGVLNAVSDRLAQLISRGVPAAGRDGGELRRLLNVPEGETGCSTTTSH